jgi:hypothetical protein
VGASSIGAPSAAPSAPAPAPAPAPPPPAPDPAKEIRDLLTRYEAALEARSLDAVRRLWPGLDGPQMDAIRREFQQARQIDVEIDDPRITANGSSATATFIRRYELLTTDGQRLRSQSRTSMTLRRLDGGWVIQQIRFEPIR